MALTQRLEFRQSQALVMTPQLMQAIKLLQLSNLDLTAYVEGELERNPLLERTSEGPGEANPPGEGSPTGAADGSGEAPDGEWAKADVSGSAAIEDSFDTGIENVFPDAEAPARPAQNEPAAYSEWANVGSGGREDGDYNLEAFVPVETTLADHLAQQLALTVADPARRMVGQYLIDLVDEAGGPRAEEEKEEEPRVRDQCPRMRRQRRSRVSGISVIAMPCGRSASAIALAIAAGAGNVPPSPAPFTPSGFSGDGVTTWWTSSAGTSVARGIA